MLELIVVLMILNFALIWPIMTIGLWHKMQNKADGYIKSIVCLAGSITMSSGFCMTAIQGLYLLAKKLM